MTVKIYSVFEDYVPAVKVGEKIVPVVLERTRRWSDLMALERALEARGYVETMTYGGWREWEFDSVPADKPGRPVTQTLEEQARLRADKGVTT